MPHTEARKDAGGHRCMTAGATQRRAGSTKASDLGARDGRPGPWAPLRTGERVTRVSETRRRSAGPAGDGPPRAASAVPTLQLSFRETFGRYELVERLGVGGMAEIWKANAEGARGFSRTFVVKRILPEHAHSPYFLSLFEDEARLVGQLYHPNIVQVYEFGVVAGSPYLAMEYLDGVDLGHVLSSLMARDEVMAPSTAAFIALEIAKALGYAHTRLDAHGQPLQVVHRDVSPENIMLVADGQVKLLDFGIALSAGRSAQSITQTRTFKGKMAYGSPEQVAGRALDGRSDVFSLGIVLWEMLTSRRLFGADSHANMALRILEAESPAPSTISLDVPPALDAVVRRALARDPAARFPSAQAMVVALEDVLRADPVDPADLRHLAERAPRPGPLAGQTTGLNARRVLTAPRFETLNISRPDETTAIVAGPRPRRASRTLVFFLAFGVALLGGPSTLTWLESLDLPHTIARLVSRAQPRTASPAEAPGQGASRSGKSKTSRGTSPVITPLASSPLHTSALAPTVPDGAH